jgi:hypothetical protein
MMVHIPILSSQTSQSYSPLFLSSNILIPSQSRYGPTGGWILHPTGVTKGHPPAHPTGKNKIVSL